MRAPRLAWLAVMPLLAACAGAPEARLVAPDAWLEEFAAARDGKRYLAVLSPNCPRCWTGVARVRAFLDARSPQQPARVFVVWTAIGEDDTRRSAAGAGGWLEAKGVIQVWDPDGELLGTWADRFLTHDSTWPEAALLGGNHVRAEQLLQGRDRDYWQVVRNADRGMHEATATSRVGCVYRPTASAW